MLFIVFTDAVNYGDYIMTVIYERMSMKNW